MIVSNMDGRVYSIKKFESKTGSTYARASLVDSVRDTQEEKYTTRYVNITAFGKTADFLLRQNDGDTLIIDGEYTDKIGTDKEGNPRIYRNIVVDKIRKPFVAESKPGTEPSKEEEEKTFNPFE